MVPIFGPPCRTGGAKRLPTLKPTNLAVSPPAHCYRLRPPLSFNITEVLLSPKAEMHSRIVYRNLIADCIGCTWLSWLVCCSIWMTALMGEVEALRTQLLQLTALVHQLRT